LNTSCAFIGLVVGLGGESHRVFCTMAAVVSGFGPFEVPDQLNFYRLSWDMNRKFCWFLKVQCFIKNIWLN